jgi:uncharacterized protein
MITSKKVLILLSSILLIGLSTLSHADWFMSSKVEELIKKADAGDKMAQFAVGSAYDFGEGAPRDREKAIKYYTMAAEQGLASAQNSLGSGFEAEGDYIAAASWYSRAAEQGDPLAMNSVAMYYIQGIGVPKDTSKGLDMYNKAANRGMANAMYNLGLEYASGKVVEKDNFKGCVWFVRAQKYAGNYQKVVEASTNAKTYVEKELTKEDFKKCEQEANSWSPQLVKQ